MKTAEFLNTKANYMLQVLPEHAGDDPESGLVKLPDGTDTVTQCHDGIICWMNHYFSWCIGFDSEWLDSKTHPDDYLNISEYLDENDGAKIVWQRKTLQQKVDEVRQHLGITNNNTLSVMIGREKSYLRKLLKRKASSATVEKVIAELDKLIDSQSDGNIDADNYANLKNGLLQIEIRELNLKLELSNEIAEMWEENHKQSSKLNAWLFLIIILFIGLFIAWWAL